MSDMEIYQQRPSLHIKKGSVKPNIEMLSGEQEAAPWRKSQEPSNFWQLSNQMRCVQRLKEVFLRRVFSCPDIPPIRFASWWMSQTMNGSLTEALKGHPDL